MPGAPPYFQRINHLRTTRFRDLDRNPRRLRPVRMISRRIPENEPLQDVRHLLRRPGGQMCVVPHRRLLGGVPESLRDVEQRHPRPCVIQV